MSYGNILGEILGQLGQSRSRIDQTGRNLGAGGGGLESIFGQVQDALSRSGIDLGALTGQAGGAQAQPGADRPAQGGGGFADRARDFLGEKQVGTLSGAQIGGIGAAAGAILAGGGLKGAARGGIMAILGTLAVSALRNAQARANAPETASADAAPGPFSAGAGTGHRINAGDATEAEVIPAGHIEGLVSEDAEKLAVRAMIAAAKADGQIDKDEITRIIGKLGTDTVSEAERQFVLEEMKAPLDIQGLARMASTPAQAAQIYGASLLAIHLDTEEEKRYLVDLATALGLDDATVAELHRMTGAAA